MAELLARCSGFSGKIFKVFWKDAQCLEKRPWCIPSPLARRRRYQYYIYIYIYLYYIYI